MKPIYQAGQKVKVFGNVDIITKIDIDMPDNPYYVAGGWCSEDSIEPLDKVHKWTHEQIVYLDQCAIRYAESHCTDSGYEWNLLSQHAYDFAKVMLEERNKRLNNEC